MYTSIEGIYENGHLTMLETPPTNKKSKVVITFLEENEVVNQKPKRKIGGLEGKVATPDNFNDPLEDLKEYMF